MKEPVVVIGGITGIGAGVVAVLCKAGCHVIVAAVSETETKLKLKNMLDKKISSCVRTT